MSYSRKRLYVIIPAAGSGTRMGTGKNKLLMDVGGMSVIDRTVAVFKEFAFENYIDLYGVLTVPVGALDEWVSYTEGKEDYSFITSIVEGGSSRTESVSHGIDALAGFEKEEAPRADSPVFIHDAARCLIDTKTLYRCYNAICEEDCFVCVAGVKAKNTIKMVYDAPAGSDVIVQSTPDRNLLYEVQTPQCFKFGCLYDCYEKAQEERLEATDDTALAEHFGFPVKIIEGAYSNIKITTPEDILVAQALLGS